MLLILGAVLWTCLKCQISKPQGYGDMPSRKTSPNGLTGESASSDRRAGVVTKKHFFGQMLMLCACIRFRFRKKV